MNFVFEQRKTGGDRNFGYLLGDRNAGAAVLVDPSYEPEALVERAAAQGLEVELVVNTHGHADHTNGNERARELTGAPVAAHPDAPRRPDVILEDGDVRTLGDLGLEFLHAPGHADDHLVVHLPDHAVALTGDLLFVGKIGGTADEASARREWESLARIVDRLPDETTIWPGHDYGCRPASTIGLERVTNPFLQCEDFEEFVDLKRRWASFKEEHGLV